MSALGHKQTFAVQNVMSALPPKADMCSALADVRFSNRPFGVKRFQTTHHYSVDVSRGLALLFGIGTGPFHHGVRRQGGTIFVAALPSDERQVQADIRTHLIHRPARDIIPPRGGVRVFLLLDVILHVSHVAAACLLQLNSVPSTQMRCMMTANRRASATIAFFIPRCLAIFIAQALSQDHFAERTSMIWAAS